jgi:hypothetical protein
VALQQVPARDIVFQVLQLDGVTWSDVGGLRTVELDLGDKSEFEDTTTRGSAGNHEQIPMQRGAKAVLKGRALRDGVNPDTQDAGQARCEVLGTAIGYAGEGQVRFRYPAATQWKVWRVVAELGKEGGDLNNMGEWECTFMRNGASTTAPVV